MTADALTRAARDAAPAGSWEPATRPFDLAARLPPGTRSFRTIESHTAGNPTRTILSGIPELSGVTMLERMHDLAANHDWVRTALMFEPRGGPVMSGCVLQAPIDPRADIGVLYIEASGHLPMCGHDTIGLVTVLLEAGLIEAVEPMTRVVLDTPAGLVETEAVLRDGHVESVSFVSTPSFLLAGEVQVALPGGTPLTVDVAWGGNFYAIVPAAQAGVDLDSPGVASRIALAADIRDAVDAAVDVTHPVLGGVQGCTHVMFTGEPRDPLATSRCSVVIRPGGADRSPCGTGTAARSAALVAQGRLGLGERFVHESITGGLFTATPLEHARVGAFPGVRSRIGGRAFVTGTAEWVVDPRDPQRHGFLVLLAMLRAWFRKATGTFLETYPAVSAEDIDAAVHAALGRDRTRHARSDARPRHRTGDGPSHRHQYQPGTGDPSTRNGPARLPAEPRRLRGGVARHRRRPDDPEDPE